MAKTANSVLNLPETAPFTEGALTRFLNLPEIEQVNIMSALIDMVFQAERKSCATERAAHRSQGNVILFPRLCRPTL